MGQNRKGGIAVIITDAILEGAIALIGIVIGAIIVLISFWMGSKL